ncbi:Oidioi.mRNA.OKI2018_I69.PAR.g11558.t2.cds [Oikopleura dioica]|uniref:Oidioi.mRNA.OKI2018_I69.PAR.g11558.t2.cds n=1 Tax=Oikopleura dioica TaxID=34765 RepID=A0ABN7RZL8_OIKDI|nr:Oidioi.mRNA.OKI2018_I69.PAR.g11558.t2.cds [Oikopleura dioica]
MMRPPTGSRGYASGTGNAPRVENRPLTQHGLGGMKNPRTSHGVRQVQDRNYWLGLIGAKVSEVHSEIQNLHVEMGEQEEAAESYITYKTMASQTAAELAGYSFLLIPKY